MADIIPVTRFREFIVNAVTEAYNAKARLMTGTIPIVTDDFTLEITGVLVDNLGGKGINEIEILQKSRTPSVVETTENASPLEVTKTVVDPEISTSKASDSASDDSTSEESTGTNDTSTDSAKEAANESSMDNVDERQTQAYGRDVRETTRET